MPPSNFFYVDLASFVFDPLDPGYAAPAAWNGKLSIIFMLQDGAAFSSARAYLNQLLTGGRAPVPPQAATSG